VAPAGISFQGEQHALGANLFMVHQCGYRSRLRELGQLPKRGCYSTNEYHAIIDFYIASLLVEPGLMYSVIQKMWLYLCVMYMYLHYVPERAVIALRFVVFGWFG
jgi:hypothetical protein